MAALRLLRKTRQEQRCSCLPQTVSAGQDILRPQRPCEVSGWRLQERLARLLFLLVTEKN